MKVSVTKEKLDALANAVSSKSGESIPITIDEMTDAVDGIQTGGTPVLQDKTYTVDSAGAETITADSGYDGLNEVEVNVPSAEVLAVITGGEYRTGNGRRLWDIYPSATCEQSGWISYDSDMPAYPAEYLAVPANTTVTPSSSAQTIGGADYMMEGAVTVNPIPSSYVQPTATQGATTYNTSTSNQTIASGTYLTGTQTIRAVTTSNLTADNIKSGVTVTVGDSANASRIASVTGTYSGVTPSLQTKSVTPTESAQIVTPDVGYDGLDEVNVGAISSTYVGSGITQRSSSDLSASGATVTVPSGYYSAQASKAVSSGSATPASTISGTSATVSTGTNTLTLSKTVSNTPQVSAGYISSGTAGNSSVSLTASVTTQGAQTIYPSTSDQSISASRYLTGAQTIKAVTTSNNLTADNIKSGVTVTVGDSDNASRIASITGTYSGGGGSGLTLLKTTSLGTLSTTSTSATDTGKSLSVTGYNDYDLLVVDASVDTPVNGRHTSTVSFIILTGTSNVGTKNTYTVASNKWNSKLGSTGTGSTRQSTTAYGIYANSATVSSSTMTIPLYYRYNSNSTGTLNGTYTARVYGVKLYDLIGG